MSDETEDLGHGFLESGREIIALQVFLYFGRVVVYPCSNGLRYVVYMCCLMQVCGCESGESGKLLYHRWDDEVYDSREHGYGCQHSEDDAYGSYLDVESFLKEDNDRVHEVCHYPCDEEWQEYCAQVVEHEE